MRSYDNKLTGTSNTTTYTYDTASNVVNVAYPNGVKSTLNYDTLNRLTSLTTPNTGYLYTLGATGTRSKVTELTGRAITWNYDGIYRLTGETISGAPSKINGSVGYGLDPVGNRLSETSTITGINSGSFTFNADDELTGLNYETYDADGNVLTTAGGKTFAYDSEDRLKSMNGGAVSIVYDGDGNRVEKIANGVVTKYLVDDLNPTGYAQVVEETGSSQRTYTYGLQRIDENQIINGAWTPSFYCYDGMGNVRQLENSAGVITDTYEYDAFGNLLNKTGTTPNNYLYRGEQWDSDLGLYYLRARYYNPLTGRFMSRDPLDGLPWAPKTLHKYLYVGGDPVNNVDPRGKEELFEYAIRANAAFPEAKLIDIYGCVADASLAAVDLIINPKISTSAALGAGGAVIGCVTLTPGLDELAEQGNKIVKFVKLVGVSSDWGACATDIKEFVNGLNDILSGTAGGVEITNSLTELGGCVGDALSYMLTHPGKGIQGLGF